MWGTAAAASSLLTVTRTSSDPARASAATCCTVERMSAVSVFVMDCTTIGCIRTYAHTTDDGGNALPALNIGHMGTSILSRAKRALARSGVKPASSTRRASRGERRRTPDADGRSQKRGWQLPYLPAISCIC